MRGAPGPHGAGHATKEPSAEEQRILAAYERCKRNQVQAAVELGIARSTLRRHLQKLGVIS